MITISVIKDSMFGFTGYFGATIPDKQLLAHCTNNDSFGLTEEALEEARYVAAAHGWKIEVKGQDK